MKVIVTAVLACVLSVSAVAAQKEKSPPPVATENLSFGGVADKLDLRNNTKLQAKEYWKNVQKRQVSWSGTVYEVQDGHKSRAKILIADLSRPLYKGYNIVVVTTDFQKAFTIAKGQQITFTGKLENYKSLPEGAVVDVSDAKLQ